MGSENSVVLVFRLINTESLPSMARLVDTDRNCVSVSLLPSGFISWYWVYTRLLSGHSIDEHEAVSSKSARK